MTDISNLNILYQCQSAICLEPVLASRFRSSAFWHKMADDANVGLIFEKTSDAHTFDVHNKQDFNSKVLLSYLSAVKSIVCVYC